MKILIIQNYVGHLLTQQSHKEIINKKVQEALSSEDILEDINSKIDILPHWRKLVGLCSFHGLGFCQKF